MPSIVAVVLAAALATMLAGCDLGGNSLNNGYNRVNQGLGQSPAP